MPQPVPFSKENHYQNIIDVKYLVLEGKKLIFLAKLFEIEIFEIEILNDIYINWKRLHLEELSEVSITKILFLDTHSICILFSNLNCIVYSISISNNKFLFHEQQRQSIEFHHLCSQLQITKPIVDLQRRTEIIFHSQMIHQQETVLISCYNNVAVLFFKSNQNSTLSEPRLVSLSFKEKLCQVLDLKLLDELDFEQNIQIACLVEQKLTTESLPVKEIIIFSFASANRKTKQLSSLRNGMSFFSISYSIPYEPVSMIIDQNGLLFCFGGSLKVVKHGQLLFETTQVNSLQYFSLQQQQQQSNENQLLLLGIDLHGSLSVVCIRYRKIRKQFSFQTDFVEFSCNVQSLSSQKKVSHVKSMFVQENDNQLFGCVFGEEGYLFFTLDSRNYDSFLIFECEEVVSLTCLSLHSKPILTSHPLTHDKTILATSSPNHIVEIQLGISFTAYTPISEESKANEPAILLFVPQKSILFLIYEHYSISAMNTNTLEQLELPAEWNTFKTIHIFYFDNLLIQICSTYIQLFDANQLQWKGKLDLSTKAYIATSFGNYFAIGTFNSILIFTIQNKSTHLVKQISITCQPSSLCFFIHNSTLHIAYALWLENTIFMDTISQSKEPHLLFTSKTHIRSILINQNNLLVGLGNGTLQIITFTIQWNILSMTNYSIGTAPISFTTTSQSNCFIANSNQDALICIDSKITVIRIIKPYSCIHLQYISSQQFGNCFGYFVQQTEELHLQFGNLISFTVKPQIVYHVHSWENESMIFDLNPWEEYWIICVNNQIQILERPIPNDQSLTTVTHFTVPHSIFVQTIVLDTNLLIAIRVTKCKQWEHSNQFFMGEIWLDSFVMIQKNQTKEWKQMQSVLFYYGKIDSTILYSIHITVIVNNIVLLQCSHQLWMAKIEMNSFNGIIGLQLVHPLTPSPYKFLCHYSHLLHNNEVWIGLLMNTITQQKECIIYKVNIQTLFKEVIVHHFEPNNSSLTTFYFANENQLLCLDHHQLFQYKLVKKKSFEKRESVMMEIQQKEVWANQLAMYSKPLLLEELETNENNNTVKQTIYSSWLSKQNNSNLFIDATPLYVLEREEIELELPRVFQTIPTTILKGKIGMKDTSNETVYTLLSKNGDAMTFEIL